MKKEYKTLSVSKDVYKLVKDKQDELIKKNDEDYVEIGYVADSLIKEGVNKVNNMKFIYSRVRGEGTIEDMNKLAKFLLNNGFAELETKESGFQESSHALCDYEVHIIKIEKDKKVI